MKRALLLITLLTGCCRYEVCNEGGRTLCHIENNGIKIFNLIPIASGDMKHPNENSPIWFTDTVDLDTNMRLLDEVIAKQRTRYLKDLCSYMTDESVIPLLLTRYTYHTSVELLK